MSNLKVHVIDQALFPEQDKEQWLAYLILLERYPNLTYLSFNGYHCHGIADYNKGITWQDKLIKDHVSKEVIAVTSAAFMDMTTEEIVKSWMIVNGETEKTKQEWLRSVK